MGYWSNSSVGASSQWILAHNNATGAKPSATDLTNNVMLRAVAAAEVVQKNMEPFELAAGTANRAMGTPGPAHFVKGQGIAGAIAAGAKVFASQGAAEAYATTLGG